jgi:hypothetical protein
MVTTLGRGTPEPAPRLTPQGAGAPQFAVQFSRPRAASRPDSRTNTFRWTGPGTIHILERGLLVLTRRRSPLGFRTADERFVPASEICEVFRDGDSVRVDLRDDARNTAFFQFWTGNPAIAGTIVRLLPTTRTIEYEVAPTEQVATPRPPLTLHRRRARRRFVQGALVVGLLAIAALLVTDIVIRQTPSPVVPEIVKVDVPESKPVVVTPVPHATAAEIAGAQAEIRQFDERMDGLRAQYRNASLALQAGKLSQDEFIDGINKWLIPQWRTLDSELATTRPTPGTLAALVHGRLTNTAIFWDRGLQGYAEGLQTHNFNTVIAAFDWMSTGNESRREAWRIVERAEFESTATASTARKP